MHKGNIQSRRQKTKREQAAEGKARNISRDQQTFNSNSRRKLTHTQFQLQDGSDRTIFQ